VVVARISSSPPGFGVVLLEAAGVPLDEAERSSSPHPPRSSKASMQRAVNSQTRLNGRRNSSTPSRLAPPGQTLSDDVQQAPEHVLRPRDLQVRTKVWIEAADGSVLISEFRADLLAAVAAHGSVAEAARTLELPYRTAWKKLSEMERAAGAPLLSSESGGSSGGRTLLTQTGQEMLDAYRRLSIPAVALAEAGFEHERARFP
jgi:molybdate transport system regulatory protein